MQFERPALLALAAGALLAWWWLRARPRGRPWIVDSLIVWRDAAARSSGAAAGPRFPWRRVAGVLLPLVLALAAAGPALRVEPRLPGRAVTVIIDPTPSMRSRGPDGRSPEDQARAAIAALPGPLTLHDVPGGRWAGSEGLARAIRGAWLGTSDEVWVFSDLPTPTDPPPGLFWRQMVVTGSPTLPAEFDQRDRPVLEWRGPAGAALRQALARLWTVEAIEAVEGRDEGIIVSAGGRRLRVDIGPAGVSGVVAAGLRADGPDLPWADIRDAAIGAPAVVEGLPEGYRPLIAPTEGPPAAGWRWQGEQLELFFHGDPAAPPWDWSARPSFPAFWSRLLGDGTASVSRAWQRARELDEAEGRGLAPELGDLPAREAPQAPPTEPLAWALVAASLALWLGLGRPGAAITPMAADYPDHQR